MFFMTAMMQNHPQVDRCASPSARTEVYSNEFTNVSYDVGRQLAAKGRMRTCLAPFRYEPLPEKGN